MPPGYYIFVFCLISISVVNGRTEDEQGDDEWQNTNTMSRENGENHAPVRYTDTIDIDNNQGYAMGGSGDGQRDDEWGSGFDDEDEFSGGGDREADYPQTPQRPNKRPGTGTGNNDGGFVEPPRPFNPMDTDDVIIDDKPEPETPKTTIEHADGGDEDEMPPEDPNSHETENLSRSIIQTPGLLPGIIGGAVVGLLCAVLLVMFIVYRMRKKDEGSYALEEPKMTSPSRGYTRAPTKEYWA